MFLKPDLLRKPPPVEFTPYDELTHQCRPGPWGELQYTRILIEPPREFFPDDFGAPDSPRWNFVGYTPPQLDALWHVAGLSSTELDSLRRPGVLEVSPTGIIVKPSAQFVLGLSTEARTKIYSALSVFSENPSQNEPFRFRADSADEWFGGSGLAPATITLVKRLLYRRGTSLLFSDHDVVLPLVPSADERVRLIRTLARKSTLLLKLRVKPDSDLDALAHYWGVGPRRKGLRAFLQSISGRPRGITVDVVHLLPRFARARMFTYPQASDSPEDNSHDCHWASLNFFNDPPDERFASDEQVRMALESEYAPITDRPKLGDVLCFTRPDGQIIHSCVYVAEDIVFTKNGASEITPFILMTISDMVAYYPADPPLTIRAFRRKDL